MKFTKSDVIQIENLMKITRQGTFTLSGVDSLAFADCIRWLAGLHQVANKDIEEAERPPFTINEAVSPIKEAVLPIKEAHKKPKKG